MITETKEIDMGVTANELRVGNLLTTTGGNIVEVNMIDKNGKGIIEASGMVSSDYSGIRELKHYKPIPLTEEWLLKFDFEINAYGFVINGFRIKSYVTGFFYGYIPVFIENIDEDIDDVEIKYVHQLQNLYFALTNTELILQNEK